MAGNTDAGATPAAGGATPPQTPPPDGAAGNGTQPATGAPDPDEPLGEGGKSALAKERAAAADWKAKAEKAQGELTKLQQASLSDAEKRDQRLTELEKSEAEHVKERAEWKVQQAVTRSAVRLGFQDPVDAFALIDRDAIEYDENGEPKNVDKLMNELLRAKPYLGGSGRATGSADGGNRGAAAVGHDMNDILRRAAGRA